MTMPLFLELPDRRGNLLLVSVDEIATVEPVMVGETRARENECLITCRATQRLIQIGLPYAEVRDVLARYAGVGKPKAKAE